jgi:outer membrane lipoprotein-sorting protein
MFTFIYSCLQVRSLGLFLFYLQFCFNLAAVNAAPSEPVPSKVPATATVSTDLREAKDVLRKAIAFQREAKDFALKFDASVYNSALDKQEAYHGKLLLKSTTKFSLEIPGANYVSDGVTFWEYHKQNHQVVLRRAQDLADQPLPSDVLLRFLDSEPIALFKTKVKGKEYLELRLDPTRAMKNLDSLAVLLEKSNYSLYRISSRDVSGNETQYTVTSLHRNDGIKDKEFVFVPPKGTDIVDMRE